MEQTSTRGRGRKRRMEGQEEKRKLPKRVRIPPKKAEIFQPHPLSPKTTQDGCFVFLAFEDGYTAKIFNIADVTHKNEKPIHSFEDLKPGDDVLARWSDKKFYNATVEYVGNADDQMKGKKTSKKMDIAAKKFYNHPLTLASTPQQSSSIQASLQQPSLSSQKASTAHHQPSSLWSPALPSPPPPLLPPLHSSSLQTASHQLPDKPPPLERASLQPPVWPFEFPYTQPLSDLQMLPNPQQYRQMPDIFSSSAMNPTSAPFHPSHVEKSPASQQRSSVRQPSPVLLSSLNCNQLPPHQTAKESFMSMLCSPSTINRAENTSSSESADTLPVDSPCEIDNVWKPCKKCEAEVERLKERNTKLQDLLDTLSGDHIDALRTFVDKMDQILPHINVKPTTKTRMKELYPDSGLFLSHTRLAAIHAEARKDCFRLFHLLFDEFFSAEECSHAVAFGKHGKAPEGKRVLEKSKVDAIITYIMHCSTLPGWTSVEKSKIKKALINKCRQRASKTVE